MTDSSGHIGPAALEQDEEFQDLVAEVFNTIIRAHGGTEVDAVELDYDRSVDAILYIVATIIEAREDAATNSALRMLSREVGARTHEFLKGLRRRTEGVGVHHLEELATLTLTVSLNKPN